jgi:multiple antibiotic resistance protein
MAILDAFILLLVIIDPVVSITALLSIAKNGTERRQIIKKAMIVAAVVFFLFAFGGEAVLAILGVSMNSFRAAGGILLIILGIQLSLGIFFHKQENISESAVVIGTPLISGPATIMTTMILVSDIGLFSTLAAGIPALFVTLVLLLLASRISRLIGRGSLKVLSTMMGIVTIAWGIQFLFMGVMGFF